MVGSISRSEFADDRIVDARAAIQHANNGIDPKRMPSLFQDIGLQAESQSQLTSQVTDISSRVGSGVRFTPY